LRLARVRIHTPSLSTRNSGVLLLLQVYKTLADEHFSLVHFVPQIGGDITT
jgi:hypothetical protein